MLDIHIGVRRDELKSVKRILDAQFNNRLVLSTMEDRWEDWGVNWTDEQSEKDDIIHVIISSDIPMHTLQFLAGVMLVFLNDITDEDNPFFGKMILVTDHEKWTSYYHEMNYPE